MALITKVNKTLIPIAYSATADFVMAVSIDIDAIGTSYSVYTDYSDGSGFVLHSTQTTDQFFMFLPRTKTSVILKIDYLNGVESTSCIGEKLGYAGIKNFVQIEGRLLDLNGQPKACHEIIIKLAPEYVDYMVGDDLVVNDDNIVYTDDDGYWNVFLAANKGVDTFRRIKYDKTHYDFVIGMDLISREINYDNGLIQPFNSLLPPEKLRIRRDDFYDMRNP